MTNTRAIFALLSALIISLFLGTPEAMAQTLPDTDEAYEKEYQRRIKREYLFTPPVYIPADLADAFIQLNKLIDDESKATFKMKSEEEVRRKLYFSLGKWITTNWGFYGGSRLSHYLKGVGIFHPDDMAQFIIITYHRNLNKQSLEVKALIEEFKQRREEAAQQRLQRGTILHQETRQRPRPAKSDQ